MRKLVLLGLMLWGSASAATLYTVTVKMNPVFDRSEFSIYPDDKKLEKKYSSIKKGTSAVFHVPAGRYTLYVDEMGVKPERYGIASLKINVTKSQTFTLQTDPWPVMDRAGRSAFNRLLIKMGGNTVECEDMNSDVSKICAEAQSTSWEIVRSYIQLTPELVQVTPWTREMSRLYAAKFTVGSHLYYLIAVEGTDGTDMSFSLQK